MASKDKVFLDTNVALDHLADRQPFAEHAHRLFALGETGKLTLCVSALSFSNLYYILRKQKGHVDALVFAQQVEVIGSHFWSDRRGNTVSVDSELQGF